MIPADGNFVTAIQKGDHKAGQVQGQTRQHARLINLLGVKQLVIGVNKMDCDVAMYKEARYNEIMEEMKLMLVKVGWPQTFVNKRVPIIPISGWCGDNLLEKSTNMDWWKGQKVKISKEKGMVCTTLLDCLDQFVQPAKRDPDKPIRLPVSGVYKIKGVGDVIIYKSDGSLSTSTNFSAQLQVLDIPGSIKAGYSPIGHVRCGRAACRVVQFNWRMGKDTANEKVEGAVELKTNDAAEVVFVPQQPLVVDTFANCEGLARIAFLDGNSAVMLGKVQAVNIPDMPTK